MAHLGLYGLPSNRSTSVAGVVGLRYRAVNGDKSLEALLKCRRESLVGLDLTGELGIAAYLRLVQDPEERGTRWLLLIRDIAMPSDLGEAFQPILGPREAAVMLTIAID